jgi:hypothetical protein
MTDLPVSTSSEQSRITRSAPPATCPPDACLHHRHATQIASVIAIVTLDRPCGSPARRSPASAFAICSRHGLPGSRRPGSCTPTPLKSCCKQAVQRSGTSWKKILHSGESAWNTRPGTPCPAEIWPQLCLQIALSRGRILCLSACGSMLSTKEPVAVSGTNQYVSNSRRCDHFASVDFKDSFLPCCKHAAVGQYLLS